MHFKKKPPKLHRTDLDFMNMKDVPIMQETSRFTHLILWITLAFFIIAFFWAKWAILDEVTTGEGKVIPSRQIQIIQHLEGGIVRKIHVSEGEIVKEGQKLMQIDDTRFSATVREAKIKAIDLRLTIARLKAEVNNTPFQVTPDLEKAKPMKVQQAKTLFQSRQNSIKQMQEGYELVQKELNLTEPLVSKGAISPVEVLRLKRQVHQLRSEILSFRNQALTELSKARTDLETLQETALAHKDRLARTTVTSPVRGIVKQIKINTIGGVVQPGMNILEIVPLDDSLLIEAKIRPADIGFIHSNQKAMVKITAYDFGIYGGLKGKVEQISADSITDERDESYYLVRIRTHKNQLGTKEKPLPIIPGMQASVSILTGEKSVLDYLLKPILKARQKALRER